jgi:hypothetical protein
MIRPKVVLLVLCCSGLPTPVAAQARFVVDSAWLPTRIERPSGGFVDPEGQGPNVLYFANGRRLGVTLFQVQFLGQLPRPNQAPFLLLAARSCYSCDIQTQVFVVAPDGDSLRQEQGAYGFAGTLRPDAPPPDTVIFYRARLFIGRCLADRRPVALWFQSEREETGAWKAGVYQLETVNGKLHGAFLRPRPSISATLEAVRGGQCFEIPGIDDTEG